MADVDTPFDFSQAEKKISDVLTAHPDIAAAIPVFDIWMAPTVEAVKRAGLQNKVKIYGFYADTINVPLARKNKNIVALTDGNQAAGAAIAVDQLLRHFVKKQPIDKNAAQREFSYRVITRGKLPPAGQDGPVSVRQIVRPYIARWKKEYAR